MPGDILEELKRKEEEMEALINGSRKMAFTIRETALKNARELKASRQSEIDRELKERAASFEEGLKKEIEGIEEAGRRDAESLKDAGRARMETAIEDVVKALSGGIV